LSESAGKTTWSYSDLKAHYAEGIWVKLEIGGEVRLRDTTFETSNQIDEMIATYKKANGLEPGADVPMKDMVAMQASQLIDYLVTGYDIEGLDPAGRDEKPVDKDKLRELVSYPIVFQAIWAAWGTLRARTTKSQEIEEKNSSAPSPAS
jgi:hypothetical protein